MALTKKSPKKKMSIKQVSAIKRSYAVKSSVKKTTRKVTSKITKKKTSSGYAKAKSGLKKLRKYRP